MIRKLIVAGLGLLIIAICMMIFCCIVVPRHHKFSESSKTHQVLEGAGQSKGNSSLSQTWVLVTSKIVPVNK